VFESRHGDSLDDVRSLIQAGKFRVALQVLDGLRPQAFDAVVDALTTEEVSLLLRRGRLLSTRKVRDKIRATRSREVVVNTVLLSNATDTITADFARANCAGSPYPRDLGLRSGRGLGGGMTMGLAASRWRRMVAVLTIHGGDGALAALVGDTRDELRTLRAAEQRRSGRLIDRPSCPSLARMPAAAAATSSRDTKLTGVAASDARMPCVTAIRCSAVAECSPRPAAVAGRIVAYSTK
jgi:hypothetical protein